MDQVYLHQSASGLDILDSDHWYANSNANQGVKL